MRRSLLALLMICCSGGVNVAAAKSDVVERVTAVKADGSITLSSSGNAALSNVLLPDPGRAESWLAQHVLQQEISFKAEGEDRYGRTLIMSDVQEKMLRDGVAVLYANDGKIPKEWYAAEEGAARAKGGVWGEKDFFITTQNAAQHVGAFHVVEGTITRIYEAKNATYLNFGEDWRTDFSITIPGKARRSMQTMLETLKPGSTIAVRGMIYEENGPMVKLTRADNLEYR